MTSPLTLSQVFLDHGEVAYAALTGIEQILEQYNLKITDASEEGAWSDLYDLVQRLQVLQA